VPLRAAPPHLLGCQKISTDARSAVKTATARLFTALVLTAGLPPVAHAQAADVYRGKQIRLISGHPVGGDYDVGARFLAKYLPRHIPGQPSIVVQNMPQAASIVAANFIYAQAPRDGTVIGSFSRNFASQALLGQANIEADPRRFGWLGAFSLPSRVCVDWHTAPVKTLADLFTRELIIAGGGAGSSLSIVPTVLNHVLGTKFRVVEGYKGINDAALAIERGEVQGVCMSYAQFNNYQNLIEQGKLRVILHLEETPLPQAPQVPSIYDYAKTDEQRQLLRFIFSSSEFGRPYVFPPDVPAEPMAVMRKAFADVAKDPDMLAEARKLKLDMTFIPPTQLERLVRDLYATPQATIETVKQLIPHQR
jgi:tripartite-type tricarboxylate transporter receptor subunit TctC